MAPTVSAATCSSLGAHDDLATHALPGAVAATRDKKSTTLLGVNIQPVRHGRSAGWASGGVRCGGWGQVGVGSAGIQGLPVSASRRTVMASWPCLMAVET